LKRAVKELTRLGPEYDGAEGEVTITEEPV
jgi:hypothetical protein